MGICSVPWCEKKHYCLGFCRQHYEQSRRYGRILERTRFDPNTIEIKGTIAFVSLCDNYGEARAKMLVDTSDLELLKGKKLCLMKTGHVGYYDRDSGKLKLVHRLIFDEPINMWVDHVNHNRLDNRRINLRVCTPTENNRNKKCSGVRKSKGKWRPHLMIDGKHINLGSFNSKEEAIAARREGERKYFGAFAFKEQLP